MIFNEIKCNVNTSLGLVGGMQMHPLHPPSVRACWAVLVLLVSLRYWPTSMHSHHWPSPWVFQRLHSTQFQR